MENKSISTHAELVLRIMHLKSEKFSQEEELVHKFKELAYLLHPATLMKNMAGDKEVKTGLAKAGLSLGSNYLIDKVLGRNRSVKGFVMSVFVEKLTNMIINKSGVISRIGKLFARKPAVEKSVHGYTD